MITGLIQELVAVICGLILPRIVLAYFGSAYNGIVNSITQFMAFAIVFRSGLGAVTNAALYKPLAEGNETAVSEIMVATKNFMNKVGLLLVLFILGFAVVYPFLVADELNYWFSFSLVVIIGASSFVENMFSIKYKILLQADQKYYIQTIVSVAAQILSTVFSIVLIVSGCGIHVVKIGALLGMMSTPFLLKIYVDRHYNINWKAKPDNVALKSRWDAFAQQLANIANNNVPTVVMTFFITLSEISVYSVYYMVVHNITKLFNSALSGVKATFGNMLAKNETENLRKRFRDVEFLVYTSTTIIFVTAAILITPFVLVYTKDVADADYNQYWLGIFISLVSMMSVIRIPYQLLVEAAGIFKETRNGAFVEIILNVLFSVIFVQLFGVIGVVIGGFAAAIVRTTQFAVISCKRVLKTSVFSMVKEYVFYFAISIGIVALSYQLDCFACDSFVEWVILAVPVFAAVTVIVMLMNLIFKFKQCKNVAMYLLKRRKKNGQ